MTTATKWALGVGVLVLAVVVALLPRQRSEPPAETDLGPARAAAALAPCPAASPGQDGAARRLAGVSAQCLGDGSQVDLGRATAGRQTLVNVWATWCQPCKEELPVLNAYANESGAAEVLSVQVASTPEQGLAMLTRAGVHVPTVHDGVGPSGPVREALRVPPSLPASYLVTTKGDVRFIESPRVFTSAAQVRAAVAKRSTT